MNELLLGFFQYSGLEWIAVAFGYNPIAFIVYSIAIATAAYIVGRNTKHENYFVYRGRIKREAIEKAEQEAKEAQRIKEEQEHKQARQAKINSMKQELRSLDPAAAFFVYNAYLNENDAMVPYGLFGKLTESEANYPSILFVRRKAIYNDRIPYYVARSYYKLLDSDHVLLLDIEKLASKFED